MLESQFETVYSVGGGAVIGDYITLCPGCIIGHDARVGDCSIIATGAII
jgi:UDP-3-O-[3-hydroxymyristoyl] glucosamine N-acyltransferase